MPKAAVNGVELEHEIFGPKDGPPLLLVGGLGVQILSWSQTLIDALVERGFRVIAYDNRDIGLSTKHDDWGPADIKAAFAQARAKQKVAAPYTLEDLADDAARSKVGSIPPSNTVGGSKTTAARTTRTVN